MRKTAYLLFGGALASAGLASVASAGVSFDGTLVQTSFSYGADTGRDAYSAGAVTIDTWNFSVLSDGQVQLDILSAGFFESYIDSELFLFKNDGNPIGGPSNFVDQNSDFIGVDMNGSTSSADSFLDVFLAEGEYIVAVATFGAQISEARFGEAAFGFLYSNPGGSGLPTQGNYQLDIYGDVVVPAPAGSFALIAFGGIVGARRRR